MREAALYNGRRRSSRIVCACHSYFQQSEIRRGEKHVEYTVREIRKEDDAEVERIIRSCLKEFGADHEGTAWADPDLCRFSQIYNPEGNRYWVAVGADGRIEGGVGIGRLAGFEDVCELQKMYCLPCARGTGIASVLLETALAYAKLYYSRCYLETLENMKAAQRFYEKHGFERIYEPLGETGHFECDVRYIKNL
ncbi:MAG: GNAT family N-acetyltransferase [Solobacterium sp.]|nr:GNAT family N-acetyltransferase [Solobacterium sp.]